MRHVLAQLSTIYVYVMETNIYLYSYTHIQIFYLSPYLCWEAQGLGFWYNFISKSFTDSHIFSALSLGHELSEVRAEIAGAWFV
jgi:hypothetical protein